MRRMAYGAEYQPPAAIVAVAAAYAAGRRVSGSPPPGPGSKPSCVAVKSIRRSPSRSRTKRTSLRRDRQCVVE